jgi:hypothetical protein
MTQGVRWLFTWLGVVCLLWSLSFHAGVHPGSHAGRDPSVGPWSHAGLTCICVFPSMSTTRMRIRAGPLDLSAPHGPLIVTAGDGGPPWLDTRGPPGRARATVGDATRLPATPAAQTRGRATLSPENSRPYGAQREKLSFATAFN